jgi:hypothetical protein
MLLYVFYRVLNFQYSPLSLALSLSLSLTIIGILSLTRTLSNGQWNATCILCYVICVFLISQINFKTPVLFLFCNFLQYFNSFSVY